MSFYGVIRAVFGAPLRLLPKDRVAKPVDRLDHDPPAQCGKQALDAVQHPKIILI